MIVYCTYSYTCGVGRCGSGRREVDNGEVCVSKEVAAAANAMDHLGAQDVRAVRMPVDVDLRWKCRAPHLSVHNIQVHAEPVQHKGRVGAIFAVISYMKYTVRIIRHSQNRAYIIWRPQRLPTHGHTSKGVFMAMTPRRRISSGWFDMPWGLWRSV